MEERGKTREKETMKKILFYFYFFGGWFGGGGDGLNEWSASCCTSFSVLVVSLRGRATWRGGGKGFGGWTRPARSVAFFPLIDHQAFFLLSSYK